jgi:hypothetical protein
MRTWRLLLIIAINIYITSCQKEVSGEGNPPPAGGPLPADTVPSGTNTEVGTWKFVSLSGKLAQNAEFSQAGQAVKAVSSSNFTSQNNGGTVTFDNQKMTANGITMSVNTTAKTYVYVGALLLDSMQTPLNQSFPPQNATSSYSRVGADSLHFQDGGFLNALTGGLLPAIPTGCKLKFESSNIMKMTTIYDTVTTQDFQGIPARVTLRAELVATLQKN